MLDILIRGRKLNSIDAAYCQDFIGEIGAVLGTPRTATVVAATDCTVLCFPQLTLKQALMASPSLGMKLIRSLCEKLSNSSSLLAEYHVETVSIINSGNSELSLKNYMKGLLFLLETASEDDSGEGGRNVLDYFLKTNPWGIQHGDPNQILRVEGSGS